MTNASGTHDRRKAASVSFIRSPKFRDYVFWRYSSGRIATFLNVLKPLVILLNYERPVLAVRFFDSLVTVLNLLKV
jgi:hypothetical protein